MNPERLPFVGRVGADIWEMCIVLVYSQVKAAVSLGELWCSYGPSHLLLLYSTIPNLPFPSSNDKRQNSHLCWKKAIQSQTERSSFHTLSFVLLVSGLDRSLIFLTPTPPLSRFLRSHMKSPVSKRSVKTHWSETGGFQKELCVFTT